MIFFILGRSGSGKTEYIHQKLRELVDCGKDAPVLIFPEQSSYMNEARILKQFGASVASSIPVQSFSRLARDILNGRRQDKKILTQDGKAVIMSLALEDMRDNLELFGRGYEKTDLAAAFLKIISEYKTCGATPQTLIDGMSKISDDRLRKKLLESARVYEAYDAMVSRSFLDPDDDLTRLYDALLQDNYFAGKTVLIDSFSGFTFQEMKILGCVFNRAEDVYLTLGLDPLQRGQTDSLFSPAEKTLKRLIALCRKLGKDYKTIELTSQHRCAAKNLEAVERLIYRFEEGEEEKSDGNVSIFMADDIYGETEQLARGISSLVYDEHYEYNDITVVCRNTEMYAHILESVFEKYNIPYFISYPQHIESKPVMRLVIAALEVILSSFSTEAIFVYLKTGLAGLDTQDVSLLENYAYMWDIRGRDWMSLFEFSPDGNRILSDKDKAKSQETLERIERIRKAAVKPLVNFSDRLKKSGNGAEMTEALYKLLDEIQASKHMNDLIYSLDKLEQDILADEEMRLWDLMMDILDSLHDTLGDRVVTVRRFYELVKLAIASNDISSIPHTLDHVTIGAADRIRMDSPKAVFIIGAVTDIFPALPVENGFYTEAERRELADSDLLSFDTWEDMSAKERYLAYMAVSGASDRLYISWHKQNTKGERTEASSIIREIRKIIPDVPLAAEAQIPLRGKIWSLRQAKETAAGVWREDTAFAATVRAYFSDRDDTVSFARTLDSVLLNEPFQVCSKAAKKLFGSPMRLSASKIEEYHLCPFMYFCKYGLKAQPREKADLDARVFGNTVHYILEKIIAEKGIDALIAASDTELSEFIGHYLSLYLEEMGGENARTDRFVHGFDRIGKTLLIIVRRLINEFAQSDFRPVDFELTIGDGGNLDAYVLELPTGETVNISGKIDRVDTFVKNGKKYIRIVDYKTGDKVFSMTDIIYGLNTQMLLYLSAIQKLGKNRYDENGTLELVPAGVLYMPSSVKYENVSKTEMEDSFHQLHGTSLGMNGLLLDDPDILNAMEKGCKGIFIPYKQTSKKSAGDTSAPGSLAALERFGKIFKYIDKKVMEMADRLYCGKIPALPAKGRADACRYCKYLSVCGYEEGDSCRTMAKKLTPQAVELMLDENEGEEDDDESI